MQLPSAPCPFLQVLLTLLLLLSSDPVGAKGPTFSSEARQVWFDKIAGHDFALLCEAQSYPVPLYR